MIYKFPSFARGACLVGFAAFALTLFSNAAPYPSEGLSTTWTQPDGSVLPLRVFGDEFYARTTTEDGYTVLYDEADKTYYYADLSADHSLVKSGIAAGKIPPPALAKNLQAPAEQRSAVRTENVRKYAPDRQSEWATRAANPAAAAVTGTKTGLTILVQFPNDPNTTANDPINFPATKEKMERFCNQAGYTDDGNSGSVRDFFYDQSNGLLTHNQLVTAIVTMPNARNYYNYSDYPSNLTLRDAGSSGRLLVTDALVKLKAAGIDVSSLSVDSGSNVIATSLLFAGADSGNWSKGLWPHSYYLTSPYNLSSSTPAKNVYRYQITNVASSAPVIGTICHELGHMLLGYPDLYDTDASDGESEGVGEHCIMGSGNYRNNGKTPAPIDLYLKSVSGWANITDVTASQSLTISLPSTGNVGYRIRKPGITTEYFLLENRGAGDKWANYCADKGLAIWHIDETVAADNDYQQMTPTKHYKVSIEQADGQFHLENNRNRGDTADFFDNTTSEFDDFSNPNANWWNGVDSGLAVRALSAPGATMSVQLGSLPGSSTLGVSPGTLTITAAPSSQSLTVNSNTTWSWSGGASWITCTESVNQSGRQIFDYKVNPNSSPASREATLTFTAGATVRTHTVTQLGYVPDDHGNTLGSATLVRMNSTTPGSFEKAADIDIFRINVNGPGTLTVRSTGLTDTKAQLVSSASTIVASNDDYLGINFQVTTTTNGPATFYVQVMSSVATKTGDYQLVSSFSPSTALSISPDIGSIPMAGGGESFQISSTGSFSWSKDESLTWLKSVEAKVQNGNQVFNYTVDPNTSGPTRTAVITVSNGAQTTTHTVRQIGIPYPELIDPRERTMILPTKLVSGGFVKIQADVRNTSTVASGPFIVRFYISNNDSITTFDPVIGTLSIPGLAPGETAPIDSILSLPALDKATWWFGWIYDANNQVTEENENNNLTMVAEGVAKADPAITASRDTQAFDGNAGDGAVDVTCDSSWTWTSSAAWLTSYAPAIQFGGQTLEYFVAANPTTASRTATLTMNSGGLTRALTVTQGPKPIPLVVTTFQRSGANIAMSFQSELGKSYRVMTSTDLQSWTPVSGHTAISGTGAPISRSMSGMGTPPAEGKRFFRIEKE